MSELELSWHFHQEKKIDFCLGDGKPKVGSFECFWRAFVSPWFTGVDGGRSVFESRPHLWASGGPKGLHIAQSTDPDLANRMLETKGHLFWASPECWLTLDTAHAKKHAELMQQRKDKFPSLAPVPKWKRLRASQHQRKFMFTISCMKHAT